MQYGIHVPQFGDYADARRLAELAQEAEAAGWEGFFLWDHITTEWPDRVVDTTVALTAVALSTQRIRFGPLVTPLARRRPWKVARETASLDHLSGGRLVLGVGLGDSADEFQHLGEAGERKVRAAMLDEALEVVTGLWRGEKFHHQGQHYHITQGWFMPPALQSPRIPIWAAGVWPNKAPFRRAARWDGIFPLWKEQRFDQMMPVEHVKEIVAYVRDQRRSDAPFEVAHWGITPGDPAQAAAIVTPYAEAGVTWWLENVSPWRWGWEWKGAWPLEAMRARIRRGPPQP